MLASSSARNRSSLLLLLSLSLLSLLSRTASSTGRAAGASGGSAEEGQKWTGRVAHSEEPGDQRGGPPTRDGGREKAPKPAVEAKPAEEAEGV